ncbi:SGNH/GDSL hydrolase family protein [Nocardioides limicola]|uniref:SGNH/GDSL hydrolase family protein n=1 Tax=Nocardioides limicola TaxID=2803368 RepID=UPI00193BB464|nr:SGNH/GDSL hydrolase family protein [Nocardioides sp. DJM-14]
MGRITKRMRAGSLAVGIAVGLGLGMTLGAQGLLQRQAAITRRAIGKPLGEQAPDADGTVRKRYAGTRIDLLMVGDSVAAGLGADRPKDTLGVRLAREVAKAAQRPVRLRTVARVGAESSMVAEQLASLPASYRPDVAVIVVGGNDVTHRVPVAESVLHLQEAVRWLQERGVEVVVGTCPDLGALRPVPQPLRALGARASRQLASAQREAVLAMGARAVSLAQVAGPFFITNPDEMFSLDRFHPSGMGYKRIAKAMAPSVLAALGLAERLPFGHHAP